MAYLLDTHLLLWLAAEPEKVPPGVSEIVLDESIETCFSVASLWEVAIKSSRPRPDFNVDVRALRRGLLAAGFPEICIEPAHVMGVADLPDVHRDPFDRLLIAQAKLDGRTLLTVDAQLESYGKAVRVVAQQR